MERSIDMNISIARSIDHTLLRPDATATRYPQDLPRGAPVRLRERVRESVLGAAGGGGTGRIAGEGVHRGGISAGREQRPRSRSPKPKARARGRAGNRHGASTSASLRGGNHDAVRGDIRGGGARRRTQGGAIVKVILETALLDDDRKDAGVHAGERRRARSSSRPPPASAPRGATVHDVALMRAGGGPRDGREGVRRHPHAGGSAEHDGRRRHAHRRQRQR